MAKFNFDPSEVEASTYGSDQSYEIMPDGEYKLAGVDAEEKQTQKKNGTYINAKFEVVDGPHTGRFIWQNFNIVNPNETAQRIGRQELVAWATACGKATADDTDKLLGKIFSAKIGVEKGTGGYADSNRIKAFLVGPPSRAPAPMNTPAPAAQAPVAETSGAASSNPWD
tara:strand:- start:117 stop:623 length:507 start_codon:yes stop_codon:yes gene_type:complete